ncbi:MAG TPA: NYN domain-containing protein [Clostridiaceae bacterium]|nr:NYN domain-containing protein [Clostridiaceae bacterium]
MEYLVIDGYNLINAWNDVFDLENDTLEDCRDKLVNMLSNYQGYKNINVIIVFDAHMVKGSKEKEETFDNIKIVFTKENETADNYIERFVYKHANDNVIRVVTSDYLEQRMVLISGGVRVSPRELKEELFRASKNMESNYSKTERDANPIMSHLKPDLLEILEKIRRGIDSEE